MPEEDRPNRKTRTPGPTREGDSLADVVELLLDKGIVINADIAVSVGETELLGIHIRAAIASFETAAKYGLQFPDGTDARRVEEASGRKPLDEGDDVGDAAPISVRSPSRQGVSERPRAADEADESGPTAAVEQVAETVAGERSGDGDQDASEHEAGASDGENGEAADTTDAADTSDSSDDTTGDESE